MLDEFEQELYREHPDERDLVDDIIRYESGEMDYEETVDFFQNLIDTGLAWELQGHYGRMAREAIECGVCHE